MTRVFDGDIHVHYGQAYVFATEDKAVELEDCFEGQSNGLCGASVPWNLFLINWAKKVSN